MEAVTRRFWRGLETDSEKLTIECQYAIENNHGSNECHGYNSVIVIPNIRLIRAIRGRLFRSDWCPFVIKRNQLDGEFRSLDKCVCGEKH
jgi:hypothetical protein